MQRIYETMFIVSPKLDEENRNATAEKVRDYIVERVGGTVEKFDRWGMRKLAYRVSKGFSEGDYTVIQFKADPESVDTLERFFGVTPEVFRWQTFRREDLEKAEKKALLKQEEAVDETQAPDENLDDEAVLENSEETATDGAVDVESEKIEEVKQTED
ncbi:MULTISPECIES: 30S ribosomal protein S6 [Mesotoga]|jgi:small subunit ribosomal protein S6|uniref:30S ribosomal protein S6 n=3 Tax=Kosmotogaceae TaxID=1643948 RepID=UPI0002CC538E|nr:MULTISPECIES: 30S ribosomal protein S6 [Mesotoga]MCP5456717.1 30S ribosomal protein S6 [Thermotogota bacterium]CCU86194.1 30S ribosomal protein S6 [Mesotoga infera]MCP5460581.1 30S ribosomal protein S6 [Thermotogota bacterium]MDK2944771.1 small subunit ribosomal protein [Mesotoga sp.]HNQ71595.1 30S ribosomal protein S6 [Mesotoga prima]